LIQSELNEAEAKSRRTGKPARRFKIQKRTHSITWELDERQLLRQATKECLEAMKVSGRMTIIALPRWSGLKGRSAKSRSHIPRMARGAALARAVIRATSWDFDLRHCGRRDHLDNRSARPRAIASVINPPWFNTHTR
jgi:hypothetical protein